MERSKAEEQQFGRLFDAWNVARTVALCFGADSVPALDAQKKFYKQFNGISDAKKLRFMEYWEEVRVRLELWG